MTNFLILIPFPLLLFVLPFPGTVALRLFCLAIAFVIATVFWRKTAPPVFPIYRVIAFWISLSLLSLTYAVDFFYSLGEIKNEIGYTMMALFAFYVFCDEKKKAILGIWAIALSIGVISIWSVWLWTRTGYWQENAGHGGSGTFAGLVLMAFPAFILIWFWQPSRRSLLVGIALLGLLAAAYSRQRAIWPVLGIELAMLVGLLRYKKSNPLPVTRSILTLLSIAVAGLIFVFATHAARLAAHGAPAEIENDARLLNWPAVIDRIGERPWVGAGFGRNAMKLGHPDLVPKDDPLFWHAHNVFLNYGLALGVPGIIALILLFGSFLSVYWRMYRSEDEILATLGIAGILLLASVVFRNLSNDFFQRDVSLLFWSMNGLLLGYGLRLQGLQRPPRH